MPESSMAAVDLGTAEWERSKISTQDANMLKKLGISKKPQALRFPSEESYPTPPMGYRVSFVDHLIRGLSAPIHPFLRGLLFVYGLQLHHLTPNSILHISIFITLCEAFLGIQPNWALWKRIFFCRRNGSPNVAYNIGGVVISVRPTVDYFDVKLLDSVQGWRKKWARVQPLQARKHPLWKYAGDKDVDRLSVNLEVKDLERLVQKISSLNKKDAVPSSCRVTPFSAANPLPENHPDLVSLPPLPEGGDVEERAIVSDDNQEAPSFVNEPVDSRKSAGSSEEKLAEANKRADALAQKLEQSEAARKKAELVASDAKAEASEAKAKAASVENLQKRLEDAETALNEHKAAQAAREQGILKRLKSQSRRIQGQTNQEFDLENPDNDPLLDALSYLELHGSEIREGVANASAGLSTLCPYFFPKKEEPPTFLALAQSFNSSEDLGLKMRQENMKIAVESTVALVADSQQTIDWMKVGDTDQIEQSRWRSLIKAAKPNTKKILAYLGIKPASTPSSSRPEV
ncbi:hypothetical protein QYE76_059736 [Lolium multiflorum]|uniref:Transposase (putative) gypsy type domain-containing protein n=1 Tax=Lolium multiflorum TaxID=4521 RepID=A0AAD8RXI7_LOLMU|nr:hypothetical protein QYE76_059736 [Lolium multiflorum]